MKKKKLLLHTCCAPCLSYVYELLKETYDITVFFYNPNIMPVKEYELRKNELISFSNSASFPLIISDYEIKSWTDHIREFRHLGEKSERCRKCYEFRLEKTFEAAAESGFDIVATTLSISPHKNAAWINEAGKELSGKFGIEFLDADFKKDNGFKKSAELSKKYGFYRQNYCGCIYSRMERDPDSGWSKKIKEVNQSAAGEEEINITEINFGTELDLHHFHPADTGRIVGEFLNQAAEKKYKSVRIIHGKGKSVKKRELYAILKKHPRVIVFHDDSSNWGSTVISLDNK